MSSFSWASVTASQNVALRGPLADYPGAPESASAVQELPHRPTHHHVPERLPYRLRSYAVSNRKPDWTQTMTTGHIGNRLSGPGCLLQLLIAECQRRRLIPANTSSTRSALPES